MKNSTLVSISGIRFSCCRKNTISADFSKININIYKICKDGQTCLLILICTINGKLKEARELTIRGPDVKIQNA